MATAPPEGEVVFPSSLKGSFAEGELRDIFTDKCRDFDIDYNERHFVRFLNHHAKTDFLKSFHMQSCALGQGAACRAVLLIAQKPIIRVIDLSGNQIGNHGAMYFADLLMHAPHIISLNLASNSITDQGIEAVFYALCQNTSLVSLDIGSTSAVGRNSFGPRSCRVLARMLQQNVVLSTLNISMAEITTDSILTICDGIAHNRTLHELDLSNNNILSKGASAFLAACAQSRIRDLRLGYNQLRDDLAPALSKYLHKNRAIRSLDLTGNYFTKRFTSAVTDALGRRCSLESLSISNNPLRGEGFAALGRALSTNTALAHLTAAGCEIDARGFREFCAAIERNTTLTSLCVARNPLLDDGAVRLAALIADGAPIRDLDLNQCDITDVGGDALFDAFAKSNSINRIGLRNNLVRNGPLIQRALIASPQIFQLDLDYNTIDWRIIVELQRLVSENRRAWKRGRTKRVADEVRKLAEVNGRLIATRTAIIEARADIESLEEAVEGRKASMADAKVQHDRTIDHFQEKIAALVAEATPTADRFREEAMKVRQAVGRKEDEIASMQQLQENRVAQITREARALDVVNETIRELQRRTDAITVEQDQLRLIARMKYMRARELVERMWAAMHEQSNPEKDKKKKAGKVTPPEKEGQPTEMEVQPKKKKISVLGKAPKIVRPVVKKIKIDTQRASSPTLTRLQLP
jgi:Ran GTPase-activating protein (RanGAP) involved in mRNA processing and transport